ncbi:MAG: acetyl-CoA carboxylase carboxyltransferase subunit alpha [Proteobacteria bacterium]|nr:acetyl-CoA carboxylase carboxyltransferase subunit alpha [Pseudomonadota bacterium]
MEQHFLEFETEILQLQAQIQELKKLKKNQNIDDESLNIEKALNQLELEQAKKTREVYRNLSAWEKTQVARHPFRPKAKDYIENLIEDFIPIAGDKLFSEDKAIITGIGMLDKRPVFVIGIEKGKDTKSRVAHNFGMPKPEGYRKAKRIMNLASRFNLPVISFVDTPGAFPGIEAERRGQGEAIASCIETSFHIRSPMIAVITGEGGSGGALAIATSNKIIMLEHSIYSTISPESCAAIIWKDNTKAELAADPLKMTAQDLIKHKIIDDIIKEPVGGAHRGLSLTMKRTRKMINQHLDDLYENQTDFVSHRRDKFLSMTR